MTRVRQTLRIGLPETLEGLQPGLSLFWAVQRAARGLIPARANFTNDLLMVKNLFGYDPLMPQRAVSWVRTAIARGVLSEEQVMAAAERVRAIRRRALASSRSE